MSSINYQTMGLERAATLAPRILVARVLEVGSFRFPGSTEHAAQEEGQSLHVYRCEVLRTLKGAPQGGEVRVFSSMQWFYHTHAELLRHNVISYAEPHYLGGLPAGEITVGSEVLFFLNNDLAPAGFPPGSVFLSFGEGYDRADREAEVVSALSKGPMMDFDHLVQLQRDVEVRFPDGLEIRFLGGGHKRPMTGGPQCEFTELRVKQGEATEEFRLNHDTGPDGKETWGVHPWGPYRIELRAINSDGLPTIVVRKV